MTTAAPTPAHAFGHYTPDRPLRWLEPLWEPTYDACAWPGNGREPWYVTDTREQQGTICTAPT